jgi:hypothetical protein
MNDDTLATPPDSPAPSAKKKRSGGNRWVNLLVAAAVLVFVGGVTFAIGRATAPAQAAQFPGAGQFPVNGNFPVGSFNPGQFLGGGVGNRTVTGTVSSTNGSTMTVTTATGQTVTVDLTGTTYHSKVAAGATDVTQGASVEVTVDGGQGFPGGPGASPAAALGSAQTVKASDVTIVGH